MSAIAAPFMRAVIFVSSEGEHRRPIQLKGYRAALMVQQQSLPRLLSRNT
jgi:hypothetical protein